MKHVSGPFVGPVLLKVGVSSITVDLGCSRACVCGCVFYQCCCGMECGSYFRVAGMLALRGIGCGGEFYFWRGFEMNFECGREVPVAVLS